MNKLKNAFHRTKSQDHRRSQQFVMRLSERQSIALDSQTSPPSLALHELLEQERVAYHTWWKDLDPFQRGCVDNGSVLKFIGGSGLTDAALEQVLGLFEEARHGLSEPQFYAMLRLIAHAQQGRKTNRDLIYLGAPIPSFQNNAIKALLQSQEASEPLHTRKSWWGQQSFAHDDPIRVPGPKQDVARMSTQSPSTATPLSQPKHQYTHGRSRSVPFATTAELSRPSTQDVYALDAVGATPTRQEKIKPSLVSSRSSMDPAAFRRLERGDRGQSLLLTQKFVYIPPRSTNPFEIDNEVSPFEDSPNYQPNRHSIPPPPVPDQATKPSLLNPFPTDTQNFL